MANYIMGADEVEVTPDVLVITIGDTLQFRNDSTELRANVTFAGKNTTSNVTADYKRFTGVLPGATTVAVTPLNWGIDAVRFEFYDAAAPTVILYTATASVRSRVAVYGGELIEWKPGRLLYTGGGDKGPKIFHPKYYTEMSGEDPLEVVVAQCDSQQHITFTLDTTTTLTPMNPAISGSRNYPFPTDGIVYNSYQEVPLVVTVYEPDQITVDQTHNVTLKVTTPALQDPPVVVQCYLNEKEPTFQRATVPLGTPVKFVNQTGQTLYLRYTDSQSQAASVSLTTAKPGRLLRNAAGLNAPGVYAIKVCTDNTDASALYTVTITVSSDIASAIGGYPNNGQTLFYVSTRYGSTVVPSALTVAANSTIKLVNLSKTRSIQYIHIDSVNGNPGTVGTNFEDAAIAAVDGGGTVSFLDGDVTASTDTITINIREEDGNVIQRTVNVT